MESKSAEIERKIVELAQEEEMLKVETKRVIYILSFAVM